LQVAGCGCRLQVAGCRLQVAGCRIILLDWTLGKSRVVVGHTVSLGVFCRGLFLHVCMYVYSFSVQARVCIIFISNIDKIKMNEFQLFYFFLPRIAFMRINLSRIKSKCANTSSGGLMDLFHVATIILHENKTFCTSSLAVKNLRTTLDVQKRSFLFFGDSTWQPRDG